MSALNKLVDHCVWAKAFTTAILIYTVFTDLSAMLQGERIEADRAKSVSGGPWSTST